MTTRTGLSIAILAACLAAGPARAAAVPPPWLNYQGVLRDAADHPLDGTYDMVFRFYGPSDLLLLTDQHIASDTGAVTVTGGLFTVVLGSGRLVPGACSTLPQVFRDYQEVFLEVQIGADGVPGTEILSPRTRIFAAPYAHNADNLDGLSSTAFSLVGHTHPGSDVIGKVGDSDLLDGLDSTAFSQPGHTHAGGEITSAVAQATNADAVDGVHASGFGQLGATNAWTALNTFKRPPTGTGMASGSLFVNPDSSGANYTLLGVGVGFAEKFRVDAEGDAIATGSVNVTGSNPVFRLQDASGTNLSQLSASDASDFTYLYDYQNSRYVVFSNPSGVAIGSNSITSGYSVTVPSLRVNGTPGLNGYLYIDPDGPDATQSLYFYDHGSSFGQYFRWDDSNAAFVASNDLGVGNNLFLDFAGPDADQFLRFYNAGSRFTEALYWFDSTTQFGITDDFLVDGSLSVVGAKNFVQNHPYDPELSVLYTALEGDEAGTYTRGSGRLLGGEARIALGETFALVTNPELGLTAHVTPRGAWSDLYVASVGTDELVVRSHDGAGDAEFDYIVHGLRIGFEDFRPVQPRTTQAPIPSDAYYARQSGQRPDLARLTARTRFAPGDRVPASGPARALRAAIGEYDPDVDDPNRDRLLRGVAGTDVASLAEASSDAPSAPASAAASAATIAATAGEPPARAASPWPAFAVSERVEVGDVLVLDPERPGTLRRASTVADPNVVGIVAGEPLTADVGLEAPVAGYGFVEVKVDATYGAIRPGDLLTTSATPGHAMLAYDPLPGTVLGKAIDGLETGTGLVRVLVMPR